jgi:fumarate reductase subunit D
MLESKTRAKCAARWRKCVWIGRHCEERSDGPVIFLLFGAEGTSDVLAVLAVRVLCGIAAWGGAWFQAASAARRLIAQIILCVMA